jgi:NADH:ubiquinone oxidoreductase subunit 3 (subunit A)
MLLGWVGGILGYSTVWLVSRQIGLPTWWLGPRSQPTPLYIVALPFVLPVLMLLAISLNLKRLGLYGVVAACATVVIAAGDAQTQPGLAIIQLAVSAGLLCTSLATLIASSRPRSEKKRKTASAR